ncbi:hypothetical protein AMTR_s00115p00119360 [Amborella trichopoda]|uniref:Uncharacterized protein n=1 Tax=Amborella trichopoda TaxID=13333 RepID=W1NSS3_AMBTC|nr:hypothetical protein AMTR_s00115p00119360 [Amborella trichopoda]
MPIEVVEWEYQYGAPATNVIKFILTDKKIRTSVLVVDMPKTYGIKLSSKLASDIDGLISLSWEYAGMNTGRMAEYKVRARPILMKRKQWSVDILEWASL